MSVWFLFLISCIFSSISLPQPNNPHPSPPWTILCPLSSNLIFIVAPSCTSLNVCRWWHRGTILHISEPSRNICRKHVTIYRNTPEDIPHHGQRTTYRATHHQPPTSPLNNKWSVHHQQLSQQLSTSTRPKKCEACNKRYQKKLNETLNSQHAQSKDLRSKIKQAY